MSRSIATITGPVRDLRIASREECVADKQARKATGRPTGFANAPKSMRSFIDDRVMELRNRYAADPAYEINDRFTFDNCPAPSSTGKPQDASLSETNEALLAHIGAGLDDDD